MEKTIPIIYACNDNVVNLCSVSIASIIENASDKNKYNIYVFHTRLAKENINNLEDMSIQNVNVQCININKYVNFSELYETNIYPYEMYYRYYASLILDDEKIIYLDCDTIVVGDIADLYNEELQDNPIGMVRDFTHYVDSDNYGFNSGVMLIDKKRFENMRIRERCFELLKECNKYKFPDQDALNAICKDNIKELGPEYNYQVSLAYYHKFKEKIKNKKYKNLFLNSPIVVHFSYVTKPYNNIYSKYSKQFWQYAKKSKYYNSLLDKYLRDPYKLLKESPVEEIYLDLTKEGKVGLRKILEIFIYQMKYWLLFKIDKGKQT